MDNLIKRKRKKWKKSSSLLKTVLINMSRKTIGGEHQQVDAIQTHTQLLSQLSDSNSKLEEAHSELEEANKEIAKLQSELRKTKEKVLQHEFSIISLQNQLKPRRESAPSNFPNQSLVSNTSPNGGYNPKSNDISSPGDESHPKSPITPDDVLPSPEFSSDEYEPPLISCYCGHVYIRGRCGTNCERENAWKSRKIEKSRKRKRRKKDKDEEPEPKKSRLE